MIKSVDIIFFVEHKDRELETIRRLANYLNKKGKSVLILSIYYHLYYLYIYRASIYIFPYLIEKKDWPVQAVFERYKESVLYVNLNWEQLLFPVNIEYKKPKDTFVKDTVRHIAWSDEFKQYLHDNDVRLENITVSKGNPANTLLLEESVQGKKWRKKLAELYFLSEKKKWLFLPMNYAWAFSSDEVIRVKIAKGYPEDKAWKHREYAQKCLKAFVVSIDRLAEEQDYIIIIRPHPSITEEDYINVFKEHAGGVHPSITISKAYSIREWIIASDIIGSSWSTSVWDAFNIGKPVFLYTPYKRPEWLEVWWNEKVKNIQDFNNLNSDSTDLKLLKKQESISSAQPIDIITNAILSMLSTKKGNHLKGVTWIGMRNNFRLIRSLLLSYKLMREGHLVYDKFKAEYLSVDNE